MGQEDIFKLLLVILLLANGDEDNCSLVGNINQIIIIVLLIMSVNDNEERETVLGTTF